MPDLSPLFDAASGLGPAVVVVILGAALGFLFHWFVGKSRDGFRDELSADVSSLRVEVRTLRQELDKERTANASHTIEIAQLKVRIVKLEAERDGLLKQVASP